VHKLKIQGRHEGATSDKGRRRVSEILHAARDIVINESAARLTMRKVAAHCGITVGNVSYYFPSKQALLHDLCDAVVQGYAEDWAEIVEDVSLTPEERLVRVTRDIMEDLTTRGTTHFFPELWVMALHDPVAADSMEYIYAIERAVFVKLIGQINPALSDEEQEILALYISSAMEGMTVFIGHERKWRSRAAETINVATKTFLDLVVNATSEDIHGRPQPAMPEQQAAG
jgi:AcrR family transcriptional regulator